MLTFSAIAVVVASTLGIFAIVGLVSYNTLEGVACPFPFWLVRRVLSIDLDILRYKPVFGLALAFVEMYVLGNASTGAATIFDLVTLPVQLVLRRRWLRQQKRRERAERMLAVLRHRHRPKANTRRVLNLGTLLFVPSLPSRGPH